MGCGKLAKWACSGKLIEGGESAVSVKLDTASSENHQSILAKNPYMIEKDMAVNPYQSVLKSLSLIPEEYLVQVNAYLEKLQDRISHKEKNRQEILSLAGTWSDLSDSDFADFLDKAKESGNEVFERKIDL